MLEPLDINREFEKLQDEETKNEIEIAEVEKRISFYLKFAWLLIGVGFLIGILGVVEHFMGSDMNLNVIGDYTGGVVASTWSLAGLFIIFVAFLGQKQQILHQKMELKYNQFEVKATRKELEGQKEQMIEQNKTLKQQRFETTFFQMVNLHHQIVNGIDIKHPSFGIIHGRDCFKHTFESLANTCRNIKNNERLGTIGFGRTGLEYDKIFKANQSDYGHYFRNLYTITKFIHLSDTFEKQRYADILRAQLSSHELLLLFYNGLSDYGKMKFKPLIETYELLKNMPQNSLIELEHKHQYNYSAFGETNKPVEGK